MRGAIPKDGSRADQCLILRDGSAAPQHEDAVRMTLRRRYPMADNDDIPFNRDFPLKPGVVEEVRPGVRRVLCNNPSPFTFTGTVSYIVGKGNVAIIDPGPDDEAHAQGAARRGARRDGDAYLRHPYPSRPFAEHRADQGRDRRDGLCRRPAPRLAAALREREAQSGIRRRPRFQARHRG